MKILIDTREQRGALPTGDYFLAGLVGEHGPHDRRNAREAARKWPQEA